MRKIWTRLAAPIGAVALASAAPLAASAEQAGQQGMEKQKQSHSGAQAAGQGASMDRETVREVQQKLTQRGYSVGSLDGSWGPDTQRAVMSFQESQGLEATGQLNRATLAALGVDEGGAASGQTPGATGTPPGGTSPGTGGTGGMGGPGGTGGMGDGGTGGTGAGGMGGGADRPGGQAP